MRIIVGLRSPGESSPASATELRLRGVPVETGHEAYERLTSKIFDERTRCICWSRSVWPTVCTVR